MSTNAAARQKIRATDAVPVTSWIQKISEPCGVDAARFNDALFNITSATMASLVGRVIDFAGEAEIKGEGGLTQKVGFLGAYETGGVISFSLSFHEKLFTFFGVVTPTAAPRMAGVIISASLTGVGGGEDASEDEGSWSSQAPPREDDSDRP